MGGKMERRRFQFVGLVVALIVVALFIYNFKQLDQHSKFVSVLQNQTSTLAKFLNNASPQLGADTVGDTAGDLILIPGDEQLNTMDLLQLEDLYMRYVENVQVACGRMYHMGGEKDGGYHVCEKYLKKNACLVYSFGSNRMYQFEDDLEKYYGCEIHTFDPFDKQKDHQHSKKVTFHKLGLGDKNQGELFTLKSVKEKLNHTKRTLDILKIDIDGGEWTAVPEIISSGGFDKVKLFITEFHTCRPGCQGFFNRDKPHFLERLAILRNLYNAGFRLYFFRLWYPSVFKDENKQEKTGTHELHFMKV